MKKADKAVRVWLWIGVFMILVQVVLGGVTRLTGSGLSITEWDLIMGAIPPLNEGEWQEAFDKYKQIPQYEILNKHFNLSDFKQIFLWEYVHRLWGRSIGFVFLIPFIIFLVRRQLSRKMLLWLLGAFVLGGLQGFIGWIMVKSGLTDRLWVSPLKLTLHLLAGVLLLAWMVNIAWKATFAGDEPIADRYTRNFSGILLLLVLVQVAFGGLMAGSHAALYYPTWPDMNGYAIPPNMMADAPWWKNFLSNVTTIQFCHRLLAYILFFGILYFAAQLWKRKEENPFARLLSFLLMALVVTQLVLGIGTVLLSKQGGIPVVWGVFHQLIGLILLTAVQITYIHSKPLKA